MARAITNDRVVTPDEVSLLISWFEANPDTALSYPGNILAKRLERILCASTIDPEDLEELGQILDGITGTPQGTLASGLLSTTLPLDTPPPELRFEGRLLGIHREDGLRAPQPLRKGGRLPGRPVRLKRHSEDELSRHRHPRQQRLGSFDPRAENRTRRRVPKSGRPDGNHRRRPLGGGIRRLMTIVA